MKKIFKLALILLLISNKALAASDDPLPPVSIENPIGGADDVSGFVANIINGVLGIVGVLALFYFVLGGLTWMTSQGSQDKIKKGKETLVWATFGLAMIFFSYTLVKFVLDKLIG